MTSLSLTSLWLSSLSKSAAICDLVSSNCVFSLFTELGTRGTVLAVKYCTLSLSLFLPLFRALSHENTSSPSLEFLLQHSCPLSLCPGLLLSGPEGLHQTGLRLLTEGEEGASLSQLQQEGGREGGKEGRKEGGREEGREKGGRSIWRLSTH